MLSHCCAPTSFCMSTMIPIPKGSGSMGDKKNYRGIALILVACCLSCLTHVLHLVNLIVCYPMTYNVLISRKLLLYNVFLPL